jgi:hypothetical protein
MLSPSGVSINIENKRKFDPYYLTSKTIGMGCLLTEGNHIYINRDRPDWKNAFKLLEEELYHLQEQTGAANILLRDFDRDDKEIQDFLIGEGFLKIDLPNANIIENMSWQTNEEFKNLMPNGKAKRRIRDVVFKYEHYFDVEIKDSLTDSEAYMFYKLYQNVKAKDYSINFFPYPQQMFKMMSKSPGWEFVILKLKGEYHYDGKPHIVSVMGCHKGKDHYTLVVIGMDYEYVYTHGVYRQSLFQGIKRAMQLGYHKIYMGLSADFEKRKLGATQIAKVCYVQAKDNFNFELIESLSAAVEVN